MFSGGELSCRDSGQMSRRKTGEHHPPRFCASSAIRYPVARAFPRRARPHQQGSLKRHRAHWEPRLLESLTYLIPMPRRRVML
jgi:hypothetical protein